MTTDAAPTRHDPAAGMASDQVWKSAGLCSQVDPELWFPDIGENTRAAKRICADCPVTDQCLEYALASDERFGVWGGLDAGERRRIVRRTA